jgi:hypothetical protein
MNVEFVATTMVPLLWLIASLTAAFAARAYRRRRNRVGVLCSLPAAFACPLLLASALLYAFVPHAVGSEKAQGLLTLAGALIIVVQAVIWILVARDLSRKGE